MISYFDFYIFLFRKVIYAYRHTLTFNDVWDVQRDNSSVTLVPAFEKAWNGQIQDKRLVFINERFAQLHVFVD